MDCISYDTTTTRSALIHACLAELRCVHGSFTDFDRADRENSIRVYCIMLFRLRNQAPYGMLLRRVRLMRSPTQYTFYIKIFSFLFK